MAGLTVKSEQAVILLTNSLVGKLESGFLQREQIKPSRQKKNKGMLDVFLLEILCSVDTDFLRVGVPMCDRRQAGAGGEGRQRGIFRLPLRHLGAARAAPGTHLPRQRDLWLNLILLLRIANAESEHLLSVCSFQKDRAGQLTVLLQRRVNIQVFSHALLLSICLSLSLSMLWCIRTTEQVKFLCFLL